MKATTALLLTALALFCGGAAGSFRERELCYTTALLIVALALAGCGASLQQLRERELCYTRAETEAQKRVDTECEGMAFAECPAGRRILEDLRKAHEGCP